MTAQPGHALSAQRPFPGLRPFAFADHEFFFGRQKQTSSLFRLLDRSRFIAVIGSSGSGKSSIVRAGLLPMLEDESSGTGGRNWLWTEMRPGDAPLGSLADALATLKAEDAGEDGEALHAARRERIAYALSRSSFGLTEALVEAGVAPGRSVLILVDQFEELFRFSGADARWGTDAAGDLKRREEAAHFVQLLLEIARDRDSGVHVLITMRSDFIGDCARFYGLPEAVSASQLLVPGLTREQREEVIRRPIEAAGATIEPALVERLLNDVGNELDQLPVLQHALLRLWDAAGDVAARVGTPRALTLDNYDAIGRLAGALSRHADEVMASLPGEELAVEQVFRALSEIDREGRATRRAIPVAELEAETGVAGDDLRLVLERFRADDCSFLVPSPLALPVLRPETRIDVGHEALLRRWEKISGKAIPAADDDAEELGWLALEDADGRQYRALLSLLDTAEDPGAVTLPPDQAEARLRWWQARPRTAAWADRYGGRIDDVERLLDNSMAALTAARLRQGEAERHEREEAEKRALLERSSEAHRLQAAAAMRTNRLMRRATAVVVVLLLVAIGAGIYGLEQSHFANAQAKAAEQSAAAADASAAAAKAAQAQAEASQDAANKAAADASAARALADERADQASKATSQLVNQVSKDMATGAIRVDIASDLLTAAKGALASLPVDAAQSDEITNAQILLRLTTAQVMTAAGRRSDALDQAREASTIATAALTAQPSGFTQLTNAARAHQAVGDALSIAQNQTSAAPSDALLAPGDTATEKASAAVIAAAQKAQADLVGISAIGEYKQALALAQKAAGGAPTDQSATLLVAGVANKLGNALSQQQEPDAALTYYSQAMAAQTQLSGTDAAGSADQSTQISKSMAAAFQAEGDKASALKTYRTALANAQVQAAARPDDIQPQRDISDINFSLGDLFRDQGDLNGALDAYKIAVGLDQKLMARDSSNITTASNVRADQERIGDTLKSLGNLSEAIKAYEAARQIAQSIADGDPTNVAWQNNLRGDQNRLGDLYKAKGDNIGALAAYQAARDISQTLAAADPQNTDRQAALGGDLTDVGDVLKVQGKADDALAAYRSALAIDQQLANLQPDNDVWQNNIRVDQGRIGLALRAQQNFKEALAAQQAALAIARTQASKYPDDSNRQAAVRDSQSYIGDVLLAQQDFPGALAAFREALSLSQALAEKEPGTTAWQTDISASQLGLGDALKGTGDLAGALTAYRAALAIDQKPTVEQPGDAVIDNERIGEVLTAQNDLTGAYNAYQAALQLSQTLSAGEPDNANWQIDIGDNQISLGDNLNKRGQPAAALVAFQAAVQVDRALLTADPNNVSRKDNLRVDDDRVGGMLESQNNLQGAVAAYKEAVALGTDVAAAAPGQADRATTLSNDQMNYGDALKAQGDLTDAMSANQAALSIAQTLAATDPGKLSNVSSAQSRIGDIAQAQNNLPTALTAYQAALAADQTLAAADTNKTEWLNSLRFDYSRIGDNQMAQGDFSSALADYRLALVDASALNDATPGDADTRTHLEYIESNLGDVFLALNRLPDASAAYSVAISLEQDPWAYFGRGRTAFFQGQASAAVDDMVAAVKLGAGTTNYPYYLLWLHLARLHAGTDDTAELSTNAAKMDQAAWPWAIVAYYLGQSSADTLLQLASRAETTALRDDTCEVEFYLGAERLARNDIAGAKPLLQTALQFCLPNYAEYSAAMLDLGQIK